MKRERGVEKEREKEIEIEIEMERDLMCDKWFYHLVTKKRKTKYDYNHISLSINSSADE